MAWKPECLARLGMLNQQWKSNMHPFCPRTLSVSIWEAPDEIPPRVTLASKELVLTHCLSHLPPRSRQVVHLNYSRCLWLGSCMLPCYWCLPPRPCCGSELFFWELKLCFADLLFFQATDCNSLALVDVPFQNTEQREISPSISLMPPVWGLQGRRWSSLHLYGIEEIAAWYCTRLMLRFTVIWKYNRSLFEICFITFLCIPD